MPANFSPKQSFRSIPTIKQTFLSGITPTPPPLPSSYAGISEVGIFRLPGQASRIHSLKETYDCGSQQDFSPSEDVHTVASLLKLYLRELPEPVVPHVYYESFKNATRCKQFVYILPWWQTAHFVFDSLSKQECLSDAFVQYCILHFKVDLHYGL